MNQNVSDSIYWVVTVSGKYKALVRQCISGSSPELVSGDESCMRFFDSLGNPITTDSNVTFAVLRATDLNDPIERRVIQKWTDGLSAVPQKVAPRRRRKKRRTLSESEIASIADSKAKGVKNQFLADKYDVSLRSIKKIKPTPETAE